MHGDKKEKVVPCGRSSREELDDMIKRNQLEKIFFQAENGIRDYDVTGVQTCALPISGLTLPESSDDAGANSLWHSDSHQSRIFQKIGRASCRERV